MVWMCGRGRQLRRPASVRLPIRDEREEKVAPFCTNIRSSCCDLGLGAVYGVFGAASHSIFETAFGGFLFRRPSIASRLVPFASLLFFFIFSSFFGHRGKGKGFNYRYIEFIPDQKDPAIAFRGKRRYHSLGKESVQIDFGHQYTYNQS